MRKHGKTDSNQAEIVSALRAAGASVFSTASVGDGFPDLVVGYRGKNYLFEAKRPGRKALLTVAEADFKLQWNGKINVIDSAGDAFAAMGLL